MNQTTNEYDKTHAETIYMEENKDQNLQLGTINNNKKKNSKSYTFLIDENMIKT